MDFYIEEIDYMRSIAFDDYYYLDIIHNRYKPILDNISDEIQAEQYKEFRLSYKDDYSKLIEDMFGIKLKWHEKKLVNIMSKSRDICYQIMSTSSSRKTSGESINLMCNY